MDDALDEDVALDWGDEMVSVAVFADTGLAVLAADATLTVVDDDTAGVTVNAANPLEVAEGGIATYTVVLDSRPTADVAITPVSGDGAKVSVSPWTHNFTPSAWNTPLTFTVRGAAHDDSVDERVTIGHGVDSDDTQYAAVLVNSVKVAVADTTEGQQQANQAPTVASAIGDATIVNESGTREVSLSRVFSDAVGNAVTVAQASSSDRAIAAITAVTVSANSEGTANITVTAQDADGSVVSDAFTVTVTAPVQLPGPVLDMELTATVDGVTVSWSAPETGGAPDGYIVHIRPEGGAEGKGRTKTPRAKKTKVSFDNLESGQTYKVWVRAQNAAGKGERVHDTITMPEAEPPPENGDGPKVQ